MADLESRILLIRICFKYERRLFASKQESRYDEEFKELELRALILNPAGGWSK